MVEGERLELQLPASSFPYEHFFMLKISVGCLFIAQEWLKYNIFNDNLFLRRPKKRPKNQHRNIEKR